MLFELSDDDIHRLTITAFDAPAIRALAERINAQRYAAEPAMLPKPISRRDWERLVKGQVRMRNV